MPGRKTEYDDYSNTMPPEGLESVQPHYAISWRILRQLDYVVTYITHSWGGAAQYVNKAVKTKEKVFNVYHMIAET